MNIYKRPFDDQRQMRIHLETLAITMIFSSRAVLYRRYGRMCSTMKTASRKAG